MAGNALNGHLDAEIAAGYHDAVTFFEDRIEVLPAFGLFDFSYDRLPGIDFFEQVAQAQNIAGLAHEGKRKKIDAFGNAEMGVGDIFFGERRRADIDTGKIDAFAVADGAAGDDFAAGGDAIGFEDAELHAAVGDENGITGFDVAGKVGVGGGSGLVIAFDLFGGDGEDGFFGEETTAVFEGAEADLRTLQIEQDAGMDFEFRRERAHPIDAAGMVILGAVGSVESKNIDARFEKVAENGFGIGGRAEGGNDFGGSHEGIGKSAAGERDRAIRGEPPSIFIMNGGWVRSRGGNVHRAFGQRPEPTRRLSLIPSPACWHKRIRAVRP